MRFIILFYFSFTITQICGQINLNDYEYEWENNSNIEQENAAKKDIVTFTELINIFPNDDSLYLDRSEAKMFLKDYRGAILDLNKAIELKPNYYYYFKRGNAKSKLKQKKEAIIDYTKAINLNQTDAMLYGVRATEKISLNDYYGAINDLTSAIKLEPLNGKHFFWRGFSKYYLNDYKNALLDFDTSVNFEVNNEREKALYLIYRGRTKIKLGKKDEGCVDFSLSGELGNENAYDEIKNLCR